MSDTPNPYNPTGPGVRVLAQYTKALSFKSKDGVQAEGLPAAPQIEMGVDLQAEPIAGQNALFEVTLKLMARAVIDNDVIFELDLAYAGAFDVSATPAVHIETALMIDCPRLLFPFARRQVADISRDGGFPPLLVDPIDFERLFKEQIQSSDS